VGSMPSFA